MTTINFNKNNLMSWYLVNILRLECTYLRWIEKIFGNEYVVK